MNTARLWSRLGLYGALIAAWAAMLGSLYFSEVSGFSPCTLCWYQRILMYPLAGLLALGILRRDHHLPHLVLPFSLLGQVVAIYHFLLQKTDLFGAPSTCGAGVTCTTAWVNWFGFVTIPLLAVAGFMAVTIGMLMVIAGEEGGANPVRAYRWPRWPVPVLVAVALGLYIAAAVQAGQLRISLPNVDIPIFEELPTGGLFSEATATPGPTSTPTSLENGHVLYLQHCAICHGTQAEGIENLGSPLAESPIVFAMTDSELRTVIRDGRTLDDAANRTGAAMPPFGGPSGLSDEQVGFLILYLRNLQ